jgi:hypothetical protein
LTGAAAVLLERSGAGIIASSSGSESAAPTPLRNVRRGSDFLEIIMGCSSSEMACS